MLQIDRVCAPYYPQRQSRDSQSENHAQRVRANALSKCIKKRICRANEGDQQTFPHDCGERHDKIELCDEEGRVLTNQQREHRVIAENRTGKVSVRPCS